MADIPWKYVPILHPKTKDDERCTLAEDGLFLENSVQMDDECCLVYLSTHPLADGWYRFGGENHLVEIKSVLLDDDSPIVKLLRKPIQRSFALITPGVWGSNKFYTAIPKMKISPKNDRNRSQINPFPIATARKDKWDADAMQFLPELSIFSENL